MTLMHSDQPTLQDKLNRKPLIISKAIEIIECITPQNFGIHGDWGAGKTSFLKQLRYHLDGSKNLCQNADECDLEEGKYKEKVITIWFDAWRYQHEASPVIALLQEIRNQFCTWAKTTRKAKKLTEVTIKSVLNTFDDIAKLLKIETIPFNPKTIQKTGEAWEKDHLEQRLKTDNVLVLLQEAIDILLKTFGKNTKRLVIFIDDLDRCNSHAAYRLLEGIKVYLDLNNCVFVFGLNQKVVTESIAKEVTASFISQNETELRILAEAYLEKICSSFERLSPPLDCNDLLCQFIDTKYLGHFKSALTNSNCLPPNPRKIKALSNLINQWIPKISTLTDFEDNTNLEAPNYIQALVIIAYIHQYHSDLFHKLQYTPVLYKTIQRWATKSWQISDEDDGGTMIFWEPPQFLKVLGLPFTFENDAHSATPNNKKVSSFPDPFSINMFWIQELLIDGNMEEVHVNTIIKAIS
jgi:hypothetical protein